MVKVSVRNQSRANFPFSIFHFQFSIPACPGLAPTTVILRKMTKVPEGGVGVERTTKIAAASEIQA